MGVFVQTQIAIVDGDWNVRVNRTNELEECMSYDRAMSLADALEAEDWKECAAQIRKDAATVSRSRPIWPLRGEDRGPEAGGFRQASPAKSTIARRAKDRDKL